MDIVKKNMISIACGVIALIALFAYFLWPLGGWVSTLKADTNARKQAYTELEQLRTKSRHWPNVSLENSEQPPLEQFPSEAVIAMGRSITEQVKSEAASMQQMAVALNAHKPLVPEVLPVSGDNLKFTFKEQYNKAMDETLPKLIDATEPPTKDDVERAADELWKREFRDRIIIIGGQPDPENQKQVEEEFNEKYEKLPMELRGAAARQHKIYLSPGAFTRQPAMAPGQMQVPTPNEIWSAQVKLWVQEDVCRGIAEANASAHGVPDAPIKHLLRIAVPEEFHGVGASPSGMSRPGEEDAAAGAQAGPLPKNTSLTATGRISNRLYDVMRFTMEMNVDARRIPFVIDSLTRNRFLTVLNVTSASGVDSAAAASNGFVYGRGPVAHVTLECEMLFMRDWTTPLMPNSIKARLGVPISGAQQAMAQ